MIGDTIFAVASPPGAAERGVLRVSGPTALRCASTAVFGSEDGLPRRRQAIEATLTPYGKACPLLVLAMPGPRSFTGEDVVELHLPGSPLLLARVGDRLRAAGARDATPGEFTRRAFEHGRLSLIEAEAVGDLIHAASQEEARAAIDTLRGGWRAAVDRGRALVQDGLALLEVGLDFDEDETGAVEPAQWISALEAASEPLRGLAAATPRAQAGADFVLIGATNAGKSSLCNALSGADVALASQEPATTRDTLAVELRGGDGRRVTVFDTAGDLLDEEEGTAGGGAAASEIAAVDRAALELRDHVAQRAAATLLVLDGADPRWPAALLRPPAGVVWTHADRLDGAAAQRLLALQDPRLPEPSAAPRFVVSSVDGAGIEALRAALFAMASRAGGGGAGGSSGAQRFAAQAERARVALRQALGDAREGAPPEVVACGVRDALEALDAIDGRSSPEDLLDRIFGAFCLGK